jgi:hypothetical protein
MRVLAISHSHIHINTHRKEAILSAVQSPVGTLHIHTNPSTHMSFLPSLCATKSCRHTSHTYQSIHTHKFPTVSRVRGYGSCFSSHIHIKTSAHMSFLPSLCAAKSCRHTSHTYTYQSIHLTSALLWLLFLCTHTYQDIRTHEVVLLLTVSVCCKVFLVLFRSASVFSRTDLVWLKALHAQHVCVYVCVYVYRMCIVCMCVCISFPHDICAPIVGD